MTATYELTEDQIVWMYVNLGVKPNGLDIIMAEINTSNDSTLPAFRYKVVPAGYNKSSTNCNL